MTVTNIVNQSFAASAITPIKRALAADTNLVAFNVSVTAGVNPPAQNRTYLRYAITSFDIAAASAAAAFRDQAKLIELPLPTAGNGVLITQIDPVLALGGFLYVWSDTPQLVNAVTLAVDLVEV